MKIGESPDVLGSSASLEWEAEEVDAMTLHTERPRAARTALEPLDLELREGDGRLPIWGWLALVAVAAFAVLVAPFQIVWPTP